MTSNERADQFYYKYLAGNMAEGWDAHDAEELIDDLAEAFRAVSREATAVAADAAVRLNLSASKVAREMKP